MSIALQLVNDGNGTSCTATLLGVDPGWPVSIFSRRVSNPGASPSQSWSLALAGTGPGPHVLTLPGGKGFHWVYALATGDTGDVASVPVWLRLHDDSDPVSERILQAVAARISTLDLPGIGSNVQQVKFPDLAEYIQRDTQAPPQRSTPAAIVCLVGSEQNVRAFNAADDMGYSVVVILLDKDQRDQELNRSRNLHWRQSILRAFINQPPIPVPEVWNCVLEQGQGMLLHPNAWIDRGLWHQQIGLRFITREPRGFGA